MSHRATGSCLRALLLLILLMMSAGSSFRNSSVAALNRSFGNFDTALTKSHDEDVCGSFRTFVDGAATSFGNFEQASRQRGCWSRGSSFSSAGSAEFVPHFSGVRRAHGTFSVKLLDSS